MGAEQSSLHPGIILAPQFPGRPLILGPREGSEPSDREKADGAYWFFLLAVIVLVVIVEFPLLGPPRENGYCSFREDPFVSPQAGFFFELFIKVIESHLKCVFSNCFAPWKETFADARDGDGGTIRDHLALF